MFASAAVIGCGDDFGLPPAAFENVVDTTTVFALRGTPIAAPSAYDVVNRRRARTELGELFDFAFDITDEGTPQLFPAGFFGFDPAAIVRMNTTFDAIVTAPDEGFVRDSAVTIEVGTVFVVQSRATSALCSFLGALPRYGKFRVLALDPAERSLQLELLVDANCGYRSLRPGVPEN